MYKDKWAHTQPMDPKSTLRLMRTLGPSLASLAQSSWSLLSNALRGQDCINVYVPIMFQLKFKEELSDVWKINDNYRNVQEDNVIKTKTEILILQNGWGQVTINNEVNEDKEVYFRYLGESFFHVTFFKIDEENAANKLPLKPKK